jgi:hypothetical protein
MKTRSDIQSKIHLFLLAVVAAALLAPTAALAQPNWLQYQLKVTATGYTGDPNFFSGLVQGANLLTTSISIPEGPADAYANPSISYGWLQLNAGCSVNNTSPDGNGYGAGFDSAVGGGEDVMFQDTLTITTSTLPMGTPVQVQIACVYNGSITPGTGYGNDTTTSSASVGLAWSIPGNNSSVSGPVGGVNQTNTISFVANVAVGNNNLVITPSIYATGTADNQFGGYFVGSVTASIVSQTYVDVLTPGASYTSASGTVYPTLLSTPPTLGIQPATNGITLFWPVTTTTYRLQQNSDLTTANWVSNTIPVNVVNGTNQVTVSPATGNLFFRLINP